MDKVKLGFIAKKDLDDRTQWSGTISFLKDILSKDYEIIPIVVKDSFPKRLIRKVVKVITHNERVRFRFCPIENYKCQRLVDQAAKEGCKLYFAPAVNGLISDLKMPAEAKLIYLSDATYHSMIDYYFFESMHNQMIGNMQEQRALENADAVIYSSDWAKKDAITYYHIAPEKISVFPFGANLRDCYENTQKGNTLGRDSTINLLFCGVDWKRKGADLAIECVHILNTKDKDRKYNLTILGLDAPEGNHYENITFVGRLNKNNEEEYARMIEYYQKSDIFILPTKAECSAIVFSEAAMYGLPVFTHITGGTTTYVKDRITGRCLSLGSTAEDFANSIREMLDCNIYQEYSIQARKYYEEKLNWDAWQVSFNNLINSLSQGVRYAK